MDIEKLIEKSGITETELTSLIKQYKKNPPRERYKSYNIELRSYNVKLGILADLHIGHNCYRPDILKDACYNFDKKKVEAVVIVADILEGLSGRDGHLFELTHLGATQQIDYAVEQLKQIQQPVYFILASGSHDGWYMTKGNMGLDIAKELELRLPNFKCLGWDNATLNLEDKVSINLNHPGDGTAYAVSYKLQKYLISLMPEAPDIALEGHYHKHMYMQYMGIHAMECGTLEEQTIFMKKKQTPAMLGYTIADIYVDKNKGVRKFVPEMFTFNKL